MATVERVELRVQMEGGDEYAVGFDHPQPGGGNPRFVAAQMRGGVRLLRGRLERVLEAAYGPQEAESRPAPQHHHRLVRARLAAVLPRDVAVSILVEPSEKRSSIGRTYRTDKDAESVLDALIPVVQELLAEAREGRS